ncbi:hypothetical protein BDW62DRAFT_214366 [Aspergillus aurantiobrunneus]
MGFLQYPFLSHHPSSPPSLFLSLPPLALSLLSTVPTVRSTVLPSNSSEGLPQERFQLDGTQVDLPAGVSIVPLAQSLVSLGNHQLRDLNQTGTLVRVDPGNSLSLQNSDIAFISCDSTAYFGKLDADATLDNVLNSKKAAAVLLYSTTASHCNYSPDPDDPSDYIYLFTLLSAGTARTIETQLSAADRPGLSYIVPDMASFAPTGGISDSDGGGGGTDSPNTAAMIILYSITGIITALFLSIIITGAIRAHRHPERYGPRQRPGRPRQSRARGMARAMLETIPIVKFGDNNAGGKEDVDKGDVEMSLESEVPASQELREGQTRQPPMATGGTTSPVPGETPQDTAATPAPESNNEGRTGATATEATNTDHPNFSCPICTDDFVKGQDLRVLPCNHQFHPDCIDPWLVNVSGTCPLCRIDLNPPQAEGETENQDGEARPEGQDDSTTNNQQQPVEEAAPPTTTTTTRHRRLSNYLHGTLNARRMRDASVEERLAALRSVREEASRETETENDEQRGRRNRLTARFRERFRIRTRAHGDEAAAAASST